MDNTGGGAISIMYVSDFLQDTKFNSSKVFLSGDNDFVRGLVIDKLLKGWDISETVRVNKSSDLKIYSNFTVFGPTRIAYVLDKKIDPKDGLTYVIKLSSSKITKKYKDMGFLEIVCSDFFPNQVEFFCQQYLTNHSIMLPKPYSKFICVSCGYDLLAITNTVKILYFLDPAYVQSLSYQDFALLCGRLSMTDESDIISHFVEGEYVEFLSKLAENPRLISAVLWGLVYALVKVRDTTYTKNPTWYQRKQIMCIKRLEHFGIDRVITIIHNLAESFLLKFPQIMLRLNRLLKDLQGEVMIAEIKNK